MSTIIDRFPSKHRSFAEGMQVKTSSIDVLPSEVNEEDDYGASHRIGYACSFWRRSWSVMYTVESVESIVVATREFIRFNPRAQVATPRTTGTSSARSVPLDSGCD
jgi:hypothetical protein